MSNGEKQSDLISYFVSVEIKSKIARKRNRRKIILEVDMSRRKAKSVINIYENL